MEAEEMPVMKRSDEMRFVVFTVPSDPTDPLKALQSFDVRPVEGCPISVNTPLTTEDRALIENSLREASLKMGGEEEMPPVLLALSEVGPESNHCFVSIFSPSMGLWMVRKEETEIIGTVMRDGEEIPIKTVKSMKPALGRLGSLLGEVMKSLQSGKERGFITGPGDTEETKH